MVVKRHSDHSFPTRSVTDPSEIERLLKRGEYIQKELEALYMLRKYRSMKNRYYKD